MSYYNLETGIRAWEQELERAHSGGAYKNAEKWISFWDEMSPKYGQGDPPKYHSQIISRLCTEALLTKQSTVLDVGCGSGTYSLPFAQIAHRVDCVDSSPGMLRELSAMAAQNGIDNIRTVYRDWRKFVPEQKYNLVFSSLSPAISRYTDLLKMEECSADYCCLVTYGHGSYPKVRRDLFSVLEGERQRPSELYNIIYPFNILFAMGRQPNMYCYHHNKSVKRTVVEAIAYYTAYFKLHGIESAEANRKICKYLNDISVDGYCMEEEVDHIYAAWWSVKTDC